MKLSIVIPCYNSENTIKSVISDLSQSLDKIGELDYEIICVNDCSKDNTFVAISEVVKDNNAVIGIDLAHNSGQHNALMVGFQYVTGDYVMACCDDGQSPIEKIEEMLQKIEEGFDVVSVRYISRQKRSLFRDFGTYINGKVTRWLIEMPQDVDFSIDFMAKKFVIDEIVKYSGPYSYIPGLIFRTTQKVCNVEAIQHDREAGQSGYTLKKLIMLLLNGFTAFSLKPLRLVFGAGIFCWICMILMFVISLLLKIFGGTVAWGTIFMIGCMLFLSAITMISLGIIGEYVGRIYMCLNKMPQAVIRPSCNGVFEKQENETLI